MFLHVIEVARHHLAIPSGASQHDRTLNNPHDVTCQRPCVYAPSRTMLLDGGVQIGFELQGHLVKTFREPASKRIVRITERRAEIPDDAATLALLPLAYHHLNGIQRP